MKSAYELAMERLQQAAPTKVLSDGQKAELAELDSLYKSRIAQREIALGDEMSAAEAVGDFAKAEQARERLNDERTRLLAERDERKEKVRIR
jgi:hypothetical protein